MMEVCKRSRRVVPRGLLAAVLLSPWVGLSAHGQQTTGAPGSPEATTTIDGSYLPPPPQKFQGEINLNAAQSKSAWPARVVPPKGAPNILLIMTDDVGFAAPSTFGGVIPTPALDRIANAGLRYTNFHSTSLCSPTRAALITGRNHHAVGFGVITETSTGFPGYNSIIGRENATIGRILLENGYRTAWFGKDHTTPDWVASQAGPFNQWPTGMGFEYFYGFVGGDTSQWQPNLFRNTTPIYPYVGNPGWNLTTAMADDAIRWMRQLNDIDPSKPFFLHYVPGGTHAPHHPTPEWVKKIGDLHLFDKGWNAVREQIFENQKKLGVIPQDTKLTPWPDKLLKRWDRLTDTEKKLFIRQAEVYAAYLAYTDHEISRVIQAVEDMGKLDNTLIIYISGDNGASAEGTVTGTPNEVMAFNGVELTAEEQMKWYEVWGSDQTYPHFAVGLGRRLRHSLPMDEANPRVFRRHAAGHGDLVAGEDQGRWRHSLAVPPRHRHRADAARRCPHPCTGNGRRRSAKANGWREHGLHLRSLGRRVRDSLQAQIAILRDVRRARPLP